MSNKRVNNKKTKRKRPQKAVEKNVINIKEYEEKKESNYNWKQLEIALNNCHIAHIINYSDAKDINIFCNAFNNHKSKWNFKELIKMPFEDDMIKYGVFNYPYSFQSLYDFYKNTDEFITVNLLRTGLHFNDEIDVNKIFSKNLETLIISELKPTIQIPLLYIHSQEVYFILIGNYDKNQFLFVSQPFSPILIRRPFINSFQYHDSNSIPSLFRSLMRN